MSYAIEALKCEKERVESQLEELRLQRWRADADITERQLRVHDFDAAIATLMAV